MSASTPPMRQTRRAADEGCVRAQAALQAAVKEAAEKEAAVAEAAEIYRRVVSGVSPTDAFSAAADER